MKTQPVLLIGICFSMLTGCLVYQPKLTDIPLISQKKELKVDAGISILPYAFTTISYGLTKKIAVQAFAAISDNDIYSFQGAVGYYKALENRKILEVYTGYNYGRGSIFRDANPGDLSGDYHIGFGQINFGKINCKFANMDYGIGLKTGYMYSVLTDRNYYSFYSEYGPFTTYRDKSLLMEPTAFVRLGGERLKFNLKAGGCYINKLTHTDKYLPYTYLSVGIGLNYRF